MKHLHKQNIWLGRFLASDPGRKRFQQAGKATISLVSASMTMVVLLKIFGAGPITPAIVSGIAGLIGIFFVMDDSITKKKATTWWVGGAAVIGITLGAILASSPFILNVFMLGTIFSAFYFSVYAIRYFSIGTTVFLTIYFSSILQLDATHLFWFYIGILIGVIYAYLFNFIVFKESFHMLRRGMRSFHIQSNLTFSLLMEMIEEPDSSEKVKKRLAKNVLVLNEYARIVAADINDDDLRNLWPGIQASQLRLYVFDTEMLIQTIMESIERLQELEELQSTEIRNLLVWVISSLRDAEVLSPNYETQLLREAETAVQALRLLLADALNTEEKPPDWVYPIRRIESIANHVVEAAFTIQESLRNFSEAALSVEVSEIVEEEYVVHNNEETKTLKTSTRKAIQALVGGTLAITLGVMIAPAQPYWVLLTTFIINMGTETVGRTYVKAFQRSVGTVLGAIIGFSVASLITGYSELEVVLLFTVLFLAFYFFTISYTLMSLFITMLIAFMYDLLLGGISMQLMGARVIDTIIGATIALCVSAFVLPKKTSDKVTEGIDEFLEELSSYLTAYLASFSKKEETVLTDQAFALDLKMKNMREEAQSLLLRPGGRTRSGIGRWITVMTAINYYAKHLLASSHRQVSDQTSLEILQVLQITESKLKENIQSVQEMIQEKETSVDLWSLKRERESIETLSPNRLHCQIDYIHHLYYIWRINRSILALGKELGAEIKN
ncbi:FUSC family protein [Bacillus sp. 2205SS5-2]|uniref:FUSC family protein n=1 Tax=Bacillus sp. 2205SS5-2 TaxID=3109031 RepID=UPI003005E07A